MAIPGCFGLAVTEAFAALAVAAGEATDPSPAARAAAVERHAISATQGAWKKGGSDANTIMYGCMGFDEQAGIMSLQEDVLRINWPGPVHEPDPKKMNAMLKEAESMDSNRGQYCPNPFIKLADRATVHPFGGVCMADDSSTGGCNHKGQVFSGLSGTDVYANLYVLDGAAVPTSLGVNPLYTISALAERGVQLLAEDRGWAPAERSAPPNAPAAGAGAARPLPRAVSVGAPPPRVPPSLSPNMPSAAGGAEDAFRASACGSRSSEW
jgi:cholesterol oxidase